MAALLLVPEKLLGLPTHALIIHFAVVLGPLAAVALIATGWRPQWRASFALPIALVAIAGAVAAFIATDSGEALRDSVRETARAAGTRADFGEHPEDGELARNVAALFALATIAIWGIQERLEKLPPWAPMAAYGVSSLIGLVAIVTMVSAGHSGSALVWKDLGNFVTKR